ncbi:threonine/serine exporter family protein [uncultured Neptuniibacter sp.]|uniref:threonine/serine ThrE exporter family protein n=1 Tax=uncultured Neptuniibacter sp. TaxID=502143 RepID=UPI00261FFF49|nr:threonine/serine exporter family protein [uncultured Neptuniibacter sp.]
MSFDLLDHYSLDKQPNFPPRTLPVGFMLRLAKALHTYGMTAYELESTMKRVGQTLGFGVQCLAQPTNLIMSFSHPDEPEPKTYVFRVEQGEVNLERQIQVNTVVQDVMSGGLSVSEGAKQLKDISNSPVRFGLKGQMAGFGLLSAGIAHLLGGAVPEILVALLIGVLTGLIAVKFLKTDSLKFLFPTLSAIISALLANFVASLGWLDSPYIATVSGVIVLVPGLPLTTAVAELARQNMVSGTARLVYSGTIFLQIGFGVAIGNALGMTLFPAESISLQWYLPDWALWPAIILAGVGLCFLFQSRPKDLPWVILGGLVAFATTWYGAQFFGQVMGAFIGAFVTGVVANIFERLSGVTRSVMLLPGIILLVPGSVGFQSLSLLVEKNVLEGVDTAFSMSFVAIALVTGLLFSSLVLPPKEA